MEIFCIESRSFSSFTSLQMTKMSCHIERIVLPPKQTAEIDASCRRQQLSVKKGLGRPTEERKSLGIR